MGSGKPETESPCKLSRRCRGCGISDNKVAPSGVQQGRKPPSRASSRHQASDKPDYTTDVTQKDEKHKCFARRYPHRRLEGKTHKCLHAEVVGGGGME